MLVTKQVVLVTKQVVLVTKQVVLVTKQVVLVTKQVVLVTKQVVLVTKQVVLVTKQVVLVTKQVVLLTNGQAVVGTITSFLTTRQDSITNVFNDFLYYWLSQQYSGDRTHNSHRRPRLHKCTTNLQQLSFN
ncbi:hypothetical protein CDG76_22160 [Nostoc sp. 'Peltigera membranacea cyanobiont' 210A]|nr:hypothetical protein CDG76_22160 [Nostoc sp. 'Peltigera membranacea cyanobiont' 210A]